MILYALQTKSKKKHLEIHVHLAMFKRKMGERTHSQITIKKITLSRAKYFLSPKNPKRNITITI